MTDGRAEERGGATAARRKGPRLVDAMPRPVGIVFGLAALVALAGVVIGLTHPPQRIALEDRRPPPKNGYSHYAGAVAPLPVPASVPAAGAPCPAVATTKLVAGTDGVARLADALGRLCDLSTGGVSADVEDGIRGLRGATIRLATFASTGVDSTAEFATKTIWINSRFALHKVTPVTLAPLIVQEGLYLASSQSEGTPSQGAPVERELAARRAELDVCRALIDTRKWSRGCKDAETIGAMNRDTAEHLLRGAGFD